MGDQLVPRSESNVVRLGPVFERNKVGGDDDGGELALVAQDSDSADEGIQFQGILDWLGSDEFSARSLDQILLAIGDRQISIGVDVTDIARLEPAAFRVAVFGEINKGVPRFFRTIPVALKNGGAAHQDFTVLGDADLDVRKNLAHGSDAMVDWSVHSDHR